MTRKSTVAYEPKRRSSILNNLKDDFKYTSKKVKEEEIKEINKEANKELGRADTSH